MNTNENLKSGNSLSLATIFSTSTSTTNTGNIIAAITDLKGTLGTGFEELENDGGIFLSTVFKKVLDKVTYNDYYKTTDSNMSDSNIGARKKHNVRNHLFIVNGIVNNVMKSKTKCVEIQVFDLVMAFDSLWMEES